MSCLFYGRVSPASKLLILIYDKSRSGGQLKLDISICYCECVDSVNAYIN